MRPERQGQVGEPIDDRVPEAAERRGQPVSVATLPSMKSKILATIMITPAGMKWPNASSQPARDVNQDADEREKIGMYPQPHTRGDDQTQREVAGAAYCTSKGHSVGVAPIVCGTARC